MENIIKNMAGMMRSRKDEQETLAEGDYSYIPLKVLKEAVSTVSEKPVKLY